MRKLVLNMKYISIVAFLFLLLTSCSSKRDVKDPYQMKPPYKLLNLYSQKIKPETDLVLRGYGFNWCLPEGYQKNGIGNFAASYSLEKNRNDEISYAFTGGRGWWPKFHQNKSLK